MCGIDPANPNNPTPIWVNNIIQENSNTYTIATYTNNSGVLVEATIDIISELCGTDWVLGTPPLSPLREG